MRCVWLFFALTPAGFASEPVESGATVAATARLGTAGCIDDLATCEWINFRDTAVFSPWVQAKLTDSVSAKASLDVRVHGPGSGHGLDSDADPIPWSLRAQDISVASRSRHTEFKMGVFRTAWGVADGISVTDTINPLDLENPTHFDRRLSVPTARFTAHTETLTISSVFIPFFVPASLPALPTQLMVSENELVDQRITGDMKTEIGTIESRPNVPTDQLSNTTVGAQLRWTPGVADLGLSWNRGRDSLPQVAGDLLLVGYQTDTERIDVGLPLIYPNLDTIGFTTRMLLWDPVMAWLEVAHVIPEATSVSPSEAQLDGLLKLGTIEEMPTPIPRIITQDGQPFTRWIVGTSAPVSQLLVTAQWLHGFFTERQTADLEDYALLGLQWSASDAIRIDGRTALNANGHMISVAMEYLHDDTVEIALGVQQIDGKKGSTFDGLRQASSVYSRVSMQF